MIWQELRSLVANEGGFVHKSVLGKAIGGIVKTATGLVPGVSQAFTGVRAGITGLGALRGVIRGRPGVPTQLMLPAGRMPARATVSRFTTARPSFRGEQGKQLGRAAKFGEPSNGQRAFRPGTIGPPTIPGFGPDGDCPRGTQRDPRGFCVSPISPVGAEAFMGEAIAGKYGAAFVPGSQIVDRAVCMRGQTLGDDGLCYNRGQITNKQRMWPAGRKPLLTGGEMRAISTAARAARRLEGTTKRLQRLGMMKKPAARRLPAGHRARLVHQSDHQA